MAQQGTKTISPPRAQHGSVRARTNVSRLYTEALNRHLKQGSRAGLRAAGTLGRQAVSAGFETSDMARIHRKALLALLSVKNSSGAIDGKFSKASTFFVEALKPLEQTRRARARNNGHLDRLRGTMLLRTGELAEAKRQLKRELVKRKGLESALEKSERHYGLLLIRSRGMQEHMRRLAHEILSAQERERKKISRELHDEIGQTLTAINVKLATLKKAATVTAKDFRRAISSTQRLVEKSMNRVHRFARELRPPLLDDLGIIPALHSLMKSFTKATGVHVRFKAFAGVEELDNDKRTILYRVAQEAFANITKHAHASLVEVTISKQKGAVRVEIHDNGKSFDVRRLLITKPTLRLGLLGMRERVEMVGGSFDVESRPGEGTSILVQLPFRNRR